MPAEIAATGFRVLAPWEARTDSVTHDTTLEEQIRALADKFDSHRAVLSDLARRIDALRTWGEEWEDYDAAPPATPTIGLADEWSKRLYLDVLDIGRPWLDPLVTAGEGGEVMFEWQLRGRRLTIRVSEAGVEYSKLWGTAPSLHFEDGIADTRQRRQSLWAWLAG
jgi:hypothetical protein